MTTTVNHGFTKPAQNNSTWHTDRNTDLDSLDSRLPWNYAGNPNTHVAGIYVGQLVWDSVNALQYTCTTTGNAAAAVWTQVSVPPAADSITNALLNNMNANTVKVNATSGSQNPTDLAMGASTILARLAAGNIVAATPAQLKTLLAIAYGDVSGTPTLGTVATYDVGTGANNIVQLDGSGHLPALNGAALTNLPGPAAGIGCWLTYNLATSTILHGYNVGSVAKNTTGDITITFSSALAHADYGVAGSGLSTSPPILEVVSASTTQLNVISKVPNAGGNYDNTRFTVIVVI